VLMVVISHGLNFIPGSDTIMLVRTMLGFFGVEIFFCLSGFLIGGIFLDVIRNFDGSLTKLTTFMTRRWFRTLPNYYFYLAVNITISLVGLAAPIPTDIGRYLVFTQNIVSPHPTFFPEAWSLSIEEIFYFLLPLTFFGIWAILRKPVPALLATLFLLLSVSMALRYHGAMEATLWDEQVRKVTLFRIDSLMWGVLLSILHRTIPASRRCILQRGSYAIACLLPIAVYTTTHGTDWMNKSLFAKFWLFPIASLGICGILSLGLKFSLPRMVTAITSAIAKLSYSMYLSNIAVLLVMLYLVGVTNSTADNLIRLAAYFPAVIAVSALSYYFVEKPFLWVRDRWFPAGRTLMPTGTVA